MLLKSGEAISEMPISYFSRSIHALLVALAPGSRPCFLSALAVTLLASAVLRADDWPEIRGKGRLGIWNETGIVDKFPSPA